MTLGAAASLLRAEGAGAGAATLGSVANVYASVEKMDAAYLQGPEARDALLVNDSLPSGPSTRLLPTTSSAAAAAASTSTTEAPTYCSMCPPPGMHMPAPLAGQTYLPYQYQNPYYAPTPAPAPAPAPESGVALLPPPDAGLALLPPSLYRCHACHALGSPQGSRGFVQGVASYTVMDDLTVAPASTASTLALLRRLGVKDLDAVEERTVTVGRKECLEILKVSLQSKTVLTDVFLAKTTNKRARTAGDENDDDAAGISNSE
ncbi:hypothetical protein PVAP13_5KG087948 [Panicum virgatum]|uniref:Uncharacterized protein n=1 Tax=Panicum virgatum TaxID=38727 RepID=A0A8T0SET4_PANVG|nr:hypothetical protein PVAP13_5KG084800 [Panicum virgatum]KAG2595589.1 hypothetical protein PVAP13_5KG087948 [Panicum virgatum]